MPRGVRLQRNNHSPDRGEGPGHRGAQTHHFGSKSELVVAAVAHLATLRIDGAQRGMREFEPNADIEQQIFDFLWQWHRGPLFDVMVELWVAGRTDPTIGAAVTQLERAVSAALSAALIEHVSAIRRREDLRDLIYTAMDILRGILTSTFVHADPERAARRWRRATDRLRAAHHLSLTNQLGCR